MTMLGNLAATSQSNRPPLRQDSDSFMSKEEQERIAEEIRYNYIPHLII